MKSILNIRSMLEKRLSMYPPQIVYTNGTPILNWQFNLFFHFYLTIIENVQIEQNITNPNKSKYFYFNISNQLINELSNKNF